MTGLIEPLPPESAEALEAQARKDLDIAARAQRILEDDLFGDAIAAVREDAIKAMVDSKIDDDEARRIARLKIECLQDVVSEIADRIAGGVLAKDRLQWLESQKPN